MFERFEEAELDLRVAATLALDDGEMPPPTLLAFGELQPVAVVELRPLESEELLQALIEVLSLLLALGARRIALALPGQVREVEHPSQGDALVGPGPLLVIVTADGLQDATAELSARVLPLVHDGRCWQWREDAVVELDPHGWDICRALGVLLDAPADDLGPEVFDRRELQAQLARCLLLGHELALAPGVADLLEPDRDTDRRPTLGH